jgi:hypothetical protein
VRITKPIHAAVTATAARAAFYDLVGKWAERYPAPLRGDLGVLI